MLGSLRSAGLIATLVLAAHTPSVAQGLPGGATALNETFGDWTVACQVTNGAIRCAMSQTQVASQSGQRVLSLQLVAAADEDVDGLLLAPFGLRLAEGVTLAVDEEPALLNRSFSTCIPAGCLVPLILNRETLRATAIADDSGNEVVFTISLSGFTGALDRLISLTAG
jgi:invasion protein IalB